MEYLIDNNCHIDTLITLPSNEGKNVSDYYDLHDFCSKNGINVIDTTNVNNPKTIAEIRKGDPDYLFTLGWSQIFKEDLIDSFSKFIVGTHPSKLPYGRGRAPLPWTVFEGLDESAVSFFKIDTGVDTGKLIFQRGFTIPKRAYVSDVYELVANELAQGFFEIYNLISQEKSINLVEQDNSKASVRGKRTPFDGLIEFDKTVDYVDRLVRAVSQPYPGAYCYYKDQKVVFWGVEFDENETYSGTLGQILKKNDKGLLVQFVDGNLWLNDPTDDNAEAIDLKFFRLGDKLGYNVQDQIFYLRKRISE